MQKEGLYRTLGDAKCVELSKKTKTLWQLLDLSETRKSTQVTGAVFEGIAKDFIREYLPVGFGLKGGLIFDAGKKMTSPQCDAIIYQGIPLLDFTDVAIVEKNQVKAIIEVKAWIDQISIFGARNGDTRNPDRSLAYDFKQRRNFLPVEAKCILFAFNLSSSSTDAEIIERLNEICDSYGFFAVVIRWESKRKQKPNIYNFDNSISWLIEWLRNLS